MTALLGILTAVVNSLWQAAALAALVWAALRFWPRTNAATRYAIWWATLAVVLILPLAPPWIALVRAYRRGPVAAAVANPAPAAARPAIRFQPVVIPAAPGRAARWPIVVAAIWAAILLWRLYQIGRSYIYLRGVKRRSTVSTILLPEIKRRANLLISADIASPMAVGFVKPAVVLPESLIEELSDAEREHVLLHEAAHLARQDDWANLASRLLAGALALHPVALWILWRIDREREIACDEWVVSRTGAARPYAKSLAKLFDLLHGSGGQMLASGIFGSGSSIADRIEGLLRHGGVFRTRASACGVTASVVVLCGMVFAGSIAPRWIAFAQEQPRRSFEVASVKPGDLNPQFVDSASQPGGRYTATNETLKEMIADAWDVAGYHIAGGPSWLDSSRFTIEGRASADEKTPNIKLMLQSLLEDRFALQVHTETREEGIYELTVAKGGAHLRAAADPAKPPRWNGRGPATGTSVSMSFLVRVLSLYLQRTVTDRTGLNGRYDLTLNFTTGLDEKKTLDSQPGSDAPSLFTAVQEQLGLRLVSAKGPADILVVDHAEKPDAN